MAAGVNQFGRINGLNAHNCRRLVRRNLRLGEFRNGKGRDDQNDRYHDQQLDQCEAAIAITSGHVYGPHSVPAERSHSFGRREVDFVSTLEQKIIQHRIGKVKATPQLIRAILFFTAEAPGFSPVKVPSQRNGL
jgi:hypothetical protein